MKSYRGKCLLKISFEFKYFLSVVNAKHANLYKI